MQSDGDLKFNSGSMNLGDKLYHHMRYYTNVVLAPSRQATSVEQTLLRTYLKRWKDADHDWKMLPVEQTLPPQLSVSGWSCPMHRLNSNRIQGEGPPLYKSYRDWTVRSSIVHIKKFTFSPLQSNVFRSTVHKATKPHVKHSVVTAWHSFVHL